MSFRGCELCVSMTIALLPRPSLPALSRPRCVPELAPAPVEGDETPAEARDSCIFPKYEVFYECVGAVGLDVCTSCIEHLQRVCLSFYRHLLPKRRL